MKTSNPATRSKVSSTSSAGSDQTKSSIHQPKCPTPRYSSFKIDSVLSPYSNLPTSSPFKFLRFDSTASPRQSRHPSALMKDIEKIFAFDENEISDSEEVSDEEGILDLAKNFKNSIFASTNDRKSSNCEVLLNKQEEGLDGSSFQEMNTKTDENFTTQITTIQEGRETPLGILPKKMFCERCKMDTTTVVNVKLPTLPFWRVLCCMNSVTDPCLDIENLDHFQEFQHKCRICKTTIATGYPM